MIRGATCFALAAALLVTGCGSSDSSTTQKVPPAVRDIPQPTQTVPEEATEPTPAAPTAPPVVAGVPEATRRAATESVRLLAAQGVHVEVAIADLNGGEVVQIGASPVRHAWSTSKLLVIAAVLHARGVNVDSATREDIRRAIRASDNNAINRLYLSLGTTQRATAAVQAELWRAGDRSTRVPLESGRSPAFAVTSFGQTDWAPADMAQFLRSLGRGCQLDAPSTALVLDHMRHVDAVQQWGASAAGWPAGSTVAVKGGWGRATDSNSSPYEILQAAIVQKGRRGLVLSMSVGGPGTNWPASTKSLTRVASAIARAGLPPASGRACA